MEAVKAVEIAVRVDYVRHSEVDVFRRCNGTVAIA